MFPVALALCFIVKIFLNQLFDFVREIYAYEEIRIEVKKKNWRNWNHSY